MFVKPEFILMARGQAQRVRAQGRTWASKSKPEMVEKPQWAEPDLAPGLNSQVSWHFF